MKQEEVAVVGEGRLACSSELTHDVAASCQWRSKRRKQSPSVEERKNKG